MKEYVNCWPEGEEYWEKKWKDIKDLDNKNEPFIWDKPFPILMPTGQKKPNNWGLYDMLGNAEEWCNDWYGQNYYKVSPIKNPKGPEKGEWKVIRGGAFCTVGWCGRREANSPTRQTQTIGFRCVRNAPKEEKTEEKPVKSENQTENK